MTPTVRFGRTELTITRLAIGGFPFGGINRARGRDPFTPFKPEFDMVDLPRITAHVYRTEDEGVKKEYPRRNPPCPPAD